MFTMIGRSTKRCSLMCYCGRRLCLRLSWALQCLYEKALPPHTHKVGVFIFVRIFYNTRLPPVPRVVIPVLGSYPCIKKYLPSYLSCENSENSPTMAEYRVEEAIKQYIPKILSLSAYFGINDPAMDIILQVNSVKSRKDLAAQRYDGEIRSRYQFLVCCNRSTPHFFEASAGYQLFEPDPFWFIPWKDEQGTFQRPPECADASLLQFFENALHTDRKTYMQGKRHYCVSIEPSILIE